MVFAYTITPAIQVGVVESHFLYLKHIKSARQADVSDADNHISVKAKMSMCLDKIRSERAADL